MFASRKEFKKPTYMEAAGTSHFKVFPRLGDCNEEKDACDAGFRYDRICSPYHAMSFSMFDHLFIFSTFAAARAANADGASEDAIRRHGRWATSDAMSRFYLGSIAREAVRVLAGFKVEKGYFYLERASIVPPQDLLKEIFPTVRPTLEAMLQSNRTKSAIETIGFLRLMDYLKLVILQDSVLLKDAFPNCPLWSYKPFNTEAYQTFYAEAKATLAKETSPFDLRVRSVLPIVHDQMQNLANAITGANRELRSWLADIDKTLAELTQAQQNMPQNVHNSVVHALKRFTRNQYRAAQAMDDGDSTDDEEEYPSYDGSDEEEKSDLETSDDDDRDDRIDDSTTHAAPGSSSRPSAQTKPTVPDYKMKRDHQTITQVWEEWDQGINGGPAIKNLEKDYQNKWRTKGADRQFFSVRKRLIDYIITTAEEEGKPVTAVVDEVEAKRDNEALSITGYIKKYLSTTTTQSNQEGIAE